MTTATTIPKQETCFIEHGTQLFDLEDTPLTAEDLLQLQQAAFELPRAHVGVGDVGEECELYVGRVMVDVAEPEVVNHQQSSKILPIIASEKITRWVERHTKHSGKLCLRRSSINYMPEGSLIGPHDDSLSNPDYLYFVALHLNDDFSGGGFFSTHYQDKTPIEFSDSYKICISRCELTHGVKKVTKGLRATLIWFYADVSAPRINSRNYQAAPLPAESDAGQGFRAAQKN